jgi:hypothetical protein
MRSFKHKVSNPKTHKYKLFFVTIIPFSFGISLESGVFYNTIDSPLAQR